MRGLRCALVLLLLGLAARAGAAGDAASELREMESRRQRASVDADLLALDALLGDELRFVHANGRVATKAEFLESLASGTLDYLSIRARDLEAHVFGEAGTVTGSADLEVRAGGGPVQEIRNLFTAVYARRHGAWQLVAYQSTSAAGAGDRKGDP